MSDAPALRVSGALAEALAPAVLGAVDAATLKSWLMQRRWFASKGREPAMVRVHAVIPLPWSAGGEAADAIGILAVDPGERDAGLRFYQLPLAVRVAAQVPPEAPVLLRVETTRQAGAIIDATLDPDFRRRLADAFRGGAQFGDAGARWSVAPLDPRGVALESGSRSRVVSAEQSNTSIIFGEQAILKLFRRLEPGINPDVEIGQHLTARSHFPHTPQLLGTITLSWDGGEPAIAGMLQRFLPGSRDAWVFALERLAVHLRDGAPDFTAEAHELGRITRELHEALAARSDAADFAAERATAEDVTRWAADTRRSAERGLDLLAGRREALPADARGDADALLDRRDELMRRIEVAADAARSEPGLRIRHHGDYHLGQVLRTGDGRFMIIDFEGEPSRPLAERRAKHSPLRDVAGMLRSFAYAAAVGATEAMGSVTDAPAKSARWEEGARAAFLTGYHDAARSPELLPRSSEGVRALISLFELEKVCYELGYELDNRPDWVWIPMLGLRRELDS